MLYNCFRILFAVVGMFVAGCEETKQVWETKITNAYPSLSTVPCRPQLPAAEEVAQETEDMKSSYEKSVTP